MTNSFTPGPWQYGEFERYEGAGKRFNISQAEGAKYTPHYSDVAQTVPGERLDIQEANARLIAAAPDLLEALSGVMALHKGKGEGWNECFDRVGDLFYRDTGMLRPGKDQSPHAGHSGNERQETFDKWVDAKFDAAREAIAKAAGDPA